jgi:peptide/nickel transport system substrate-binding protein
MREIGPWDRLNRRRLSRRALLRASGRAGVGAAGLALAGCGRDDDDEETPEDQSEAPDEPAADEPAAEVQAEGEGGTGVKANEADPVAGGIAELFGMTDQMDRWDPHRSRFRASQGFLSLMYNRLVRPDSVGAGTLEADLAELPEMPDETTYVFRLNPAAVFWTGTPANGRAVTSEDVQLSVERQSVGVNTGGDPDLRFYRQGLFSRAAVEAVDPGTVTFQTEAPDATFLSTVLAGPWSFIVSQEGIEEFGPQWDISANDQEVALSSGSGPFVPIALLGDELSLGRSDNWWGESPVLLDGIRFRRPDSAAIAGEYANGRLDRADFPLSVEEMRQLREAFPDDVAFEYPLEPPVQLSYVISRDLENPLSDPRVGTALSWSIDRFVMIDRLFGGEGRPSGPLPWYLTGWALAEEDLLLQPGYRTNKDEDMSEINLRLEAAGGTEAIGEIDVIVADLFEGFFPGIAQTLRLMVEQNTGLTISTRFGSYEEITAGLQDGTLPAFFGWGPTPVQADPTDLWRRTAHSEGSENYGRYANADVDGLIEEMVTTPETGARQRLAKQVQELMLATGFWQQNVTNGIQLGLHKPYFHQDPRVEEFAWAGHHLAASWIDVEDEEYAIDRELPERKLELPQTPRDGDARDRDGQ